MRVRKVSDVVGVDLFVGFVLVRDNTEYDRMEASHVFVSNFNEK